MTERLAKQVIVMRRDLKMRRGKEIAQGAHASIAFMTKHGTTTIYRFNPELDRPNEMRFFLTPAQSAWINGIFTKICVRVESEEELLEIAAKAEAAGLTTSLIQDAGLTEFGGVPTYTCCAIGPDWSDEVDAITGELTLL